ncbi:putative cytochrome P450 [Mycobacterium xenopi 3993]|nr:putative cytochrome P450 [Mycobacterium xenopi 3993]
MQMICILLGVPEADRHWLFEAVEPGFDFGASRTASMPRLNVEDAGSQLYAYGQELIARKRAQPADDMLSTVANATIDDPDAPSLSDAELYLFFHLLFSAGAETTRNAIAGGLLALAERPNSGADCAATSSCCRRRSKRWCGGRRRRRRSGAPPPGQSPWVASRLTPVKKCWCGKARPTATPLYSTDPTSLISPENLTRTWVLVRGYITAWAPTWPGWNCGCFSRSCWRALGRAGRGTGRMGPQQPAHRD